MPFIPPSATIVQPTTGPGSSHSSIASYRPSSTPRIVIQQPPRVVIQQPPASTGTPPPTIIHIPSNRSDSQTPSPNVAQHSGVGLNAPTVHDPIIIQQPSVSPGIQPPAVIRIGDPRTPTPPPIRHLEYPNYSVASLEGTPSSIASHFSSYYSEAFSAERTGRTKRYAARARPADLPVIRRFRENELQMHAFEGKDHVTMGVLSEAGRMIAVKPVNFRFDGGEYASESAIMNEFDDWLRLWGSLRHDNIAELVGSVFFNGTPSVITYRVASGNVGDYLRGNPQADRPNLLRQVAEGLQYLHTRPVEIVLHSNLKPCNILVENGRVELGDIGILEFLEMKGVGAEMHGKTGDVRWTAPEVLEGPDRQWWSDVYSFGCLALYILKDEIPYSTLETDVAVSKAIYRGELPVNRDAASKLHPTWKLCWSHDPKRRPNMRTVLESLDDW
ncbi:hypothetical protein FRC05_008308 [Tulasnella sp. 425]|nr:hypothetical protein FRC05_008308 [Tulasnella sp. 425]